MKKEKPYLNEYCDICDEIYNRNDDDERELHRHTHVRALIRKGQTKKNR